MIIIHHSAQTNQQQRLIVVLIFAVKQRKPVLSFANLFQSKSASKLEQSTEYYQITNLNVKAGLKMTGIELKLFNFQPPLNMCDTACYPTALIKLKNSGGTKISKKTSFEKNGVIDKEKE